MSTFNVPLAALAASFLAMTTPVFAQEEQPSEAPDTQESAQATGEQSVGDAQAGGAESATEIRPLTVTCRDIVDTDVNLVPQLVYWIDGYNIAYDAATGATDVDPVVTVEQDWLAVPAQNVITACEATPDRAAADVISEERQKAAEAN